jgi:hypothetical protein
LARLPEPASLGTGVEKPVSKDDVFVLFELEPLVFKRKCPPASFETLSLKRNLFQATREEKRCERRKRST